MRQLLRPEYELLACLRRHALWRVSGQMNKGVWTLVFRTDSAGPQFLVEQDGERGGTKKQNTEYERRKQASYVNPPERILAEPWGTPSD
jgi:hypothetical protein